MINQIARLRACLAQNYEPKFAIKDKTPRLFEAKEQDRTAQTNLYDHRIKKMKKLFKNVNVAGLAVVLMAAGVITTQSAFKAKRVTSLYHIVGSNWEKTNRSYDQTPTPGVGYDPHSYRCDGLAGTCSAEIESTAPSIPVSSNPTLINQKAGTFTPNN